MTEEVTEMPRCCSSAIQSDVACRAALRPLTVPASWIAPPNSSNFSVSVVLPASGWEMIAKVRLLLISFDNLLFASSIVPDRDAVRGFEHAEHAARDSTGAARRQASGCP